MKIKEVVGSVVYILMLVIISIMMMLLHSCSPSAKEHKPTAEENLAKAKKILALKKAELKATLRVDSINREQMKIQSEIYAMDSILHTLK